MFADALLVNLLLFAVGQAVGWFHLRTGRAWLGWGITVLLWGCGDAALVLRFVYDHRGPDYLAALGVVQATAVLAALHLLFARWRRRWSAVARQRPERFRAALIAYLRGDFEAAAAGYRTLARTDPWDPAAWVALGNVLRRLGRVRRAAACYRHAAAVDRTKGHLDLVRQQQRLLRAPQRPKNSTLAAATPPAATSNSAGRQ